MKIIFCEPSIENNCWIVAFKAEESNQYFKLRHSSIFKEKFLHNQKCLQSPVFEISHNVNDTFFMELITKAKNHLRVNPQTKGFFTNPNSTVGIQIVIMDSVISKAKPTNMMV